ncbi:porimin [Pseudonaja textilis]|uniref:Transmembrane protein 123 n=1 Tax=Pseudonaja textilis TaxID=8673 RepID=A0A670Y4N6_PSETE|nr:porimin [Pseudonaja textilis]
MNPRLLPWLVLLAPFCLSGSIQGTDTNTTAAHLSSSSISNSSTTAKTVTITNTTQKSVKTTAHPEVTSKIPAITNKTIPAAQSTIASKTDKPIQPASTKHSPTESGTHKTTAVPVTKPSSALVTEVSAIRGNPSGFSAGSFIGGIVLTLGLLALGYIGCRFYHTKRGVQYRTIDEHDAII